MSYTRRVGAAGAILLTTALCGCGGGPPPPPPGAFPALHYGFLPPIRLNVATVSVQNDAPSSDLAGQSPVAPGDALANMAQDRLVADGSSGAAVFTITDASIARTDAGLTERLAAHLDIIGTSGAHQGFAEAEVSRSATGDAAIVGPATLYALTQAAMQDMNVEFEFQVRRHLADWIVSPGATVEAPVSTAPLAPGGDAGAGAPGTQAPGAPLSLAPPPAAGAPMSLAPPPATSTTLPPPPESLAPPMAAPVAPGQMSPPPGTLGTLPAAPANPAETPDLDVPPPSIQAPAPIGGGY